MEKYPEWSSTRISFDSSGRRQKERIVMLQERDGTFSVVQQAQSAGFWANALLYGWESTRTVDQGLSIEAATKLLADFDTTTKLRETLSPSKKDRKRLGQELGL